MRSTRVLFSLALNGDSFDDSWGDSGERRETGAFLSPQHATQRAIKGSEEACDDDISTDCFVLRVWQDTQTGIGCWAFRYSSSCHPLALPAVQERGLCVQTAR